MKPDDMDQLKELVAFLKENEIAEFEMDRGDFKVRLKFGPAPSSSPAAGPISNLDMASLARLLATPSASAPAAPVDGSAPAPVAEETLHIVKSPIVGTFYESPSPGSSAFVSNGDHVEKGQILCIVEAMKLMNEIESDAAGEIVKRLVTNGQAIEYGQPLFSIRTS